jgi:two-component system probable response regulator PhcQ
MRSTVLLVDDEQDLLDGLARSLRHAPYRVLTATSGQTALEVLANTPVDVIVADEMMPGMTGTELLAEVRAEHPSIMRVILTGQAKLESAVAAINEGEVYRFLTKPCGPAELTVTIQHALQHKALMDQAQRLLRTVECQSRLLDQIERANPGITKLDRTPDGAIVVDADLPSDFSQFMKQLHERVENAARALTDTSADATT